MLNKDFHYLTTSTAEQILGSYLPVVINCYSDWCPACSQMKPIFENLAVEFSNKCLFAKVRLDEEIQFAGVFQIEAMPCFLFIYEGTLYDKITGSIGYYRLFEAIKEFIKKTES